MNFRRILREVKQSGEIHLVLDCGLEKITQLLKVTAEYWAAAAQGNS